MSSLAAFAFNAADIAAKYVVDQGDENGSHAHDNIWAYNNLKADTSFFRWIKACTNSEDSFFDIGTECTGNYDLSCDTNYTFKIYGDYVPSEGTISNLSTQRKTTTSMGTTMFRPKQGWLVERIPYAKIAARTKQLGLSEETRERHLNNVGKPMYFAHEAPLTLVQ